MPKLDGILETALYTDDMARARQFYEEVMELEPIYADERLCAYGVAGRDVLLLFRRGTTRNTVTMPGGTIPGHDGSGPLHVAFAIGRDELDEWERRWRHGDRDRRPHRLGARRPQHLFPRSRRAPAGTGDAGIVDHVLKRAAADLSFRGR